MPARTCSAAIVLCGLTAAAAAVWLGGCASDRLVAAAPAGVNLTGNWRLNANLSDDPDRLFEQDKSLSKPDSGGRHGRGRQSPAGSGTGLPPIGMGTPQGLGWNSGAGAHLASDSAAPLSAQSFQGNAPSSPTDRETALSGDWAGAPRMALAQTIEQSNPLPPGTAAPAKDSTAGGPSLVARLLAAPTVLAITQEGAKVTIHGRMQDGTTTADDYVAGMKATVPYKDGTADRSAGWRGPIFVTTTKTKTGWREDDYALDEDGRLIVTSEIKAGRLRQLEIKHVYDRVTP